MSKDRILTGVRSNGTPHLGNYLGAMLPMVQMQKAHSSSHEIFFFVPDLHSFTTPIDHSKLFDSTIRNLKLLSAAGLDFWADDTYLYRQSYVPAHSELAWILGCFTYFGELNRMTQFKDKVAQIKGDAEALDVVINKVGETGGDFVNYATGQNISAGLFTYPILMAADILLYGAKYVPVGDDQRQHLELARDVAMRFNMQFGDVFEDGVFKVPLDWQKQLDFAGRANGVRIRSLRHPDKKMSKSVSDPSGTIDLFDDPNAAAKKVMSATTDNVGQINLDWQVQPGISNLLQILALTTERPLDDVAAEWQDKTSYGELKTAVAENVKRLLENLQNNFKKVDEKKLLNKLMSDEQEVGKIANTTLLRAQQAVGLRPRE